MVTPVSVQKLSLVSNVNVLLDLSTYSLLMTYDLSPVDAVRTLCLVPFLVH